MLPDISSKSQESGSVKWLNLLNYWELSLRLSTLQYCQNVQINTKTPGSRTEQVGSFKSMAESDLTVTPPGEWLPPWGGQQRSRHSASSWTPWSHLPAAPPTWSVQTFGQQGGGYYLSREKSGRYSITKQNKQTKNRCKTNDEKYPQNGPRV